MGAAVLALAVPWAVWHLPTFWLDTGLADLDLVVIPGWLVGLVAGAVVLGWLYERASCSLLVVAVLQLLLDGHSEDIKIQVRRPGQRSP